MNESSKAQRGEGPQGRSQSKYTCSRTGTGNFGSQPPFQGSCSDLRCPQSGDQTSEHATLELTMGSCVPVVCAVCRCHGESRLRTGSISSSITSHPPCPAYHKWLMVIANWRKEKKRKSSCQFSPLDHAAFLSGYLWPKAVFLSPTKS